MSTSAALNPPLSPEAQTGLTALIREAVDVERPSVTTPVSDVLSMVPQISIADTPDNLRLHIGVNDILFDGKPFPFVTVGKWVLTFEDDGVTTLNLSIAVGFKRAL